MSKTLALEAAQGIGDEDTNVFSEPTDVDFVRQSSRVECEDKKTGVSTLAVAERGDPADVRDSVTPQIRLDLLLRHVTQFWGEDCTFGCVAAGVKCDGDLFVTKGCCFEQCFCRFPCVCFDDQSAVCWSLYLYLSVGTTNSGDLLLWPEHVDRAE